MNTPKVIAEMNEALIRIEGRLNALIEEFKKINTKTVKKGKKRGRPPLG